MVAVSVVIKGIPVKRSRARLRWVYAAAVALMVTVKAQAGWLQLEYTHVLVADSMLLERVLLNGQCTIVYY